jgi:hypothetical protein
VEEKKHKFGTVEERLMYYADFYDLKTILHKNWEGEFKNALGNWKNMEFLLDELGRFRDPNAHRRELLPHKHLALGIAGEIRTRLVRYRSKQETNEDYYPRIESARDNLGNIWTEGILKWITTETILRPGDILDLIITANDPMDEELEYGIAIDHLETDWQNKGTFSIKITEKLIQRILVITLRIRSPRKYHAYRTYDDSVDFIYEVLPPKNS